MPRLEPLAPASNFPEPSHEPTLGQYNWPGPARPKMARLGSAASSGPSWEHHYMYHPSGDMACYGGQIDLHDGAALSTLCLGYHKQGHTSINALESSPVHCLKPRPSGKRRSPGNKGAVAILTKVSKFSISEYNQTTHRWSMSARISFAFFAGWTISI